MSTLLTLVSSPRPLRATLATLPLPDGALVVHYHFSGGVPVFECLGQTITGGRFNVAPEAWRAWQGRGIDLVVEPGAPSPARTVRLTATSGRNLLTTDNEPTAVTGTARLTARLLFADSTGMSFKIALDGGGVVEITLADVSTGIRPPPPKLPVDAPKPN